jgi:hypothetical protein
MYFVEALQYPFRGARSITVALVLGIVLVIPFVNILGAFFALGYASRLLPLIYQGIDDKPEFDVGGDFGRGILVLVAAIVYNILPYIVFFPILLLSEGNTPIFVLVLILLILVQLVANLGFIVALLRYSLQGQQTGVLFEIPANYRRALANPGASIMLIINLLIFNLLAGIAIIIGFILLIVPGIILSAAFNIPGTFHLYASYGKALGIQPAAPVPNQPFSA